MCACPSTDGRAFFGEVAEWSIAAVLKTVDPQGSGGSNPSLSASARSRSYRKSRDMSEKEENDLFYVCSPSGHVGRKTKNRRGDVVAAMDDACLESYKAGRAS